MAETSSASHLLRRMRWSSWTHRRDALSSAVLITKNGGFLILEIWWSVRGLQYTVYIYTYIHTHTHTYTHVHLHTYVCTYVYSYLPTCLPACLHIDTTNIHTYIHACMHAYIHTYLHCIALHYITYIHYDVSFTMWNPRYFLETPYAFIRHPTKSYYRILLLETLQIPSQVYPKDIPMIPQLYPNISRYRNISQDSQFGIPIWRYLSAPPGIHTYYEGYPGYHRGGWRLRSGPKAGKRQKWKMPSKMITLVTSKKRGFNWFLLFSNGFMAISWFSWRCRWDIIGIQSTVL